MGDAAEYFDDTQDVKVTKDMLARHAHREPEGGALRPGPFEDQYEAARIDLINQKRAGKPIVAKERPRAENVADLMDARLRLSAESLWRSSKQIRRMVEP